MVNPKYVKKNKQPMFENVSLGVIVRDELMNPAGGILPMLQRHIPYFPEVHVLDTGSKDGTKGLLEHLSNQYSHLTVYHKRFRGYGHARNQLGKKIKTKYVLALDADEMLFSQSARQLSHFIDNSPDFSVASLGLKDIAPQGIEEYGRGWYSRLYNPRMTKFHKLVWENHKGYLGSVLPTNASIHHFVPKKFFRDLKGNMLYNSPHILHWFIYSKTPSKFPSFNEWKKPNSSILLRYGINVFDIIKQIEDIGIKFPDKLRPE